jgi:hypothetical protein
MLTFGWVVNIVYHRTTRDVITHLALGNFVCETLKHTLRSLSIPEGALASASRTEAISTSIPFIEGRLTRRDPETVTHI